MQNINEAGVSGNTDALVFNIHKLKPHPILYTDTSMHRTLWLTIALTIITGIILKELNIGTPFPAEPMIIYGFSILLSALIAQISGDHIMKTWIRFAKWAIPAIFISYLLTPHYGQTGVYHFEQDGILWLTAISFVVLSLGIVELQLVRGQKRKLRKFNK